MVATDLINPRGFGWGADGTLYLTLAGWGGDMHIAAGPGFTADVGLTSSIVTVANGCVTPVVQGLVSAKWEEPDWVWGTMDIAFLDGVPYVLVSGAGPTWVSPTSRSGVYKLNGDGSMTLVADLTTWKATHPPKFIAPDYSSDGSLFDLEAAGGNLYLADAVGGQVLKVTPAGDISIVADLSDQHPVPTGLAVDADGNVYVGYETTPPYADGSSKVTKIAPDGTISDAWTGLTRVGDVVLGPDGSALRHRALDEQHRHRSLRSPGHRSGRQADRTGQPAGRRGRAWTFRSGWVSDRTERSTSTDRPTAPTPAEGGWRGSTWAFPRRTRRR